jgi:hypothetical protein
MNSKNKGSSFERKICKLLSQWITGGDREDILWRSISSGAWNTIKKRTTTTQIGDITYIDELGKEFIEKFAIECKSYKDVQMIKLFNENSIINKWWDKINEEAGDKYPLIIFKENRSCELIAISGDIFKIVARCHGFSEHMFIKIEYKDSYFYIIKLNDFLKIDYTAIMANIKDSNNA